MTNSNKFYITTPIYYVNARPHLGHTYTTVVCDAIARRKRSLGIDTWFLTGTDEHGQKIERSAQAAGQTPQEFATEVSAQFRSLWDRMGLTYDDYIRTTEGRHLRGVQEFFILLRDRGFIYKGSYTGQYCIFDELYVDAGPGAPCPDCGRITETVSEENYFFKLSAFEGRLLELYAQQPDFIRPETRRNEVISFVRGGLKDLSISRTSFNWGIPVPGDDKHVIYVWLDALANYITALGYGGDTAEDKARFERYWPADLQVIGKEISRFHCVYWPAFLMAAGLPLPKSIIAHGWLLFEQNKMSKSRGNIVRAETILDVLGADALRYFLLREVVFGQDGSFSFDALVQRYNSDLANGYGNLVSRTLAMITKYCDGAIPRGDSDPRIRQAGEAAAVSFANYFDNYEFSRALEALWSFVATVDGYISEKTPWKLGALLSVSTDPENRQQLANILYTSAEAVRLITALVYPILPESAARIWRQLGLGHIAAADFKNIEWGKLPAGIQLGEPGPVFPRAEKDAITRMSDLEQKKTFEKTHAPDQGSPEQNSADHDTADQDAPYHDSPGQGSPRQVTPSAATPSSPSAVAASHSGPVAATTDPEKLGHASQGTNNAEAQQFAQPGGGAAGTAAAAPGYVVDSQSTSSDDEKVGKPGGESKTQGEIADIDADARAPASVGSGSRQPQTEAPAASAAAAMERIGIEDFVKVELRVAQIKVAERVPKADKLLRLEVDLGYETRQILAGIAEHYAPETLIGRKVVIVANLKPRMMRGLESNGMIVAASLGDSGKPVLAGFLEEVAIGARLK